MATLSPLQIKSKRIAAKLEVVYSILATLMSHRDYEGILGDYTEDGEWEYNKRCEIAISYAEFRVRVDNEERFEDDYGNYHLGYDEHWFGRFSDVLRLLGLGDVVRNNWGDITVNDLSNKAFLEEIQTEFEKEQNKTPKEQYAEYLKSEHWQKMRREALERAGYRCQICNGGFRLEVHHRSYERLGKEHPYDLTVLCNRCHELYEQNRRPPQLRR